jgi:hypothetical protein
LAPKVSLTLCHAPSHLKVFLGWNAKVYVAILWQIHRPWIFNDGHWLSRLEVASFDIPDSRVKRWFVFVSHGLSC